MHSMRGSSIQQTDEAGGTSTAGPRVSCHLYPSVPSHRTFAADRFFITDQLFLSLEYDLVHCDSCSLYLYHRLTNKWLKPIPFDGLLASAGIFVHKLTARLNIIGLAGPRTFVVLGKHCAQDESGLARNPLELFLHYFTLSEDLDAVALSRSVALFCLPNTQGSFAMQTLFTRLNAPWYLLFRQEFGRLHLFEIEADEIRDLGTISNNATRKHVMTHKRDVFFVTEKQEERVSLHRYDARQKELQRVARLQIKRIPGHSIHYRSFENHLLAFVGPVVYLYNVTSAPFAPARLLDVTRNQCQLQQTCYTAVLFTGNEIMLSVCRRVYDEKLQRSQRVGGLCSITCLQPLALCQMALRVVHENLAPDTVERLDHRSITTIEELVEFLLR